MPLNGFLPNRRTLATVLSVVALAVPLSACSGPASMLDTAGPGADPVATVWWVMFWGSVVIFLGVLALAAVPFILPTARRPGISAPTFIIWGGLVLPMVVVTGLLAYGVGSGQALLPTVTDESVPRIEVTGHQWWWEVRYPDAARGTEQETDGVAGPEQPAVVGDAHEVREADPSVPESVNEVHIPAGQPVDIHLTSADVIHGFWVPRLGGKIDAIPGRVNVIRIEADRPGSYTGVCAEFCGTGHAHMHFRLIAHEPEDYAEILAELEVAE